MAWDDHDQADLDAAGGVNTGGLGGGLASSGGMMGGAMSSGMGTTGGVMGGVQAQQAQSTASAPSAGLSSPMGATGPIGGLGAPAGPSIGAGLSAAPAQPSSLGQTANQPTPSIGGMGGVMGAAPTSATGLGGMFSGAPAQNEGDVFGGNVTFQGPQTGPAGPLTGSIEDPMSNLVGAPPFTGNMMGLNAPPASDYGGAFGYGDPQYGQFGYSGGYSPQQIADRTKEINAGLTIDEIAMPMSAPPLNMPSSYLESLPTSQFAANLTRTAPRGLVQDWADWHAATINRLKSMMPPANPLAGTSQPQLPSTGAVSANAAIPGAITGPEAYGAPSLTSSSFQNLNDLANASIMATGIPNPATATPQQMAAAANLAQSFPSGLMESLIQQESSWDPKAVSSSGAQGLTQMKEGAQRTAGITDITDPQQQIFGGARYLGQMPGANLGEQLGAYTIGPTAFNQTGMTPKARSYSDAIMSRMPAATPAASAPASAAAPLGGLLSPAAKAATQYGSDTLYSPKALGDLWKDTGMFGIGDFAAPRTPYQQQLLDRRSAYEQALLGQTIGASQYGGTVTGNRNPNLSGDAQLDPTTAGVGTHWTGDFAAPENIRDYGYGVTIDPSGNINYARGFDPAGMMQGTHHMYANPDERSYNRELIGISSVGVEPNPAQLQAAAALGGNWFNANPQVTSHGYEAGTRVQSGERSIPSKNVRQPAEGEALKQAFLGGQVPGAPTSPAPAPQPPIQTAIPARPSMTGPTGIFRDQPALAPARAPSLGPAFSDYTTVPTSRPPPGQPPSTFAGSGQFDWAASLLGDIGANVADIQNPVTTSGSQPSLTGRQALEAIADPDAAARRGLRPGLDVGPVPAAPGAVYAGTPMGMPAPMENYDLSPAPVYKQEVEFLPGRQIGSEGMFGTGYSTGPLSNPATTLNDPAAAARRGLVPGPPLQPGAQPFSSAFQPSGMPATMGAYNMPARQIIPDTPASPQPPAVVAPQPPPTVVPQVVAPVPAVPAPAPAPPIHVPTRMPLTTSIAMDRGDARSQIIYPRGLLAGASRRASEDDEEDRKKRKKKRKSETQSASLMH